MEKLLVLLIEVNSIIFLISCSSVFSSSLISVIPLGMWETCNIYDNDTFGESCRYQYIIFVGVYTLILGVMIFLFEFAEHRTYLITVCILRIIVIFVISITSLIALGKNKNISNDEELITDIQVIDLTGFGVTLSTVFMTISYQVILPDILLHLKNKKEISFKAINLSYFFSFSLLVLIGMSTYFGVSDIEALVTLNWKDYSNGRDPSDREWWAYVIDNVVSVYPAIDVTSVSALIFNNAVDNVTSFTYKADDSDTNKALIFQVRVVFLVIICLISIVFYDLGVLITIFGNITFVSVVIFINLLGKASLILVPETCEYDNFLANPKFVEFLTIFSSLLTILVVISSIIYFI